MHVLATVQAAIALEVVVIQNMWDWTWFRATDHQLGDNWDNIVRWAISASLQ